MKYLSEGFKAMFSLPGLSMAVVLVALLLSGCAGLSPDVIKAMEGQSSSLCIKGANWNGSPLEAHYASFGGKSTGTAGGGGEATCGGSTVKFNNDGKAPPVVKMIPEPK